MAKFGDYQIRRYEQLEDGTLVPNHFQGLRPVAYAKRADVYTIRRDGEKLEVFPVLGTDGDIRHFGYVVQRPRATGVVPDEVVARQTAAAFRRYHRHSQENES